MTVYVPDVGDGLAAGISTIDHTSIEIDCGSQNDAEIAFHKGLYSIRPHVFFLSHFQKGPGVRSQHLTKTTPGNVLYKMN